MFVLKTSFPPLCTKYIDLNALASVRQVLRDRLQCETRKTRYIAAHIKFKAFMFAYRTSTGFAPLYLNSVLQTYVPREACVLQENNALLFIPKRHKITFTDFYMNCSHLVTCTIQSKLSPQPSSRISSIFI